MTDDDRRELATISAQLQTVVSELGRVREDLDEIREDLKPSGLYVTRAEWDIRTKAVDREVADLKQKITSMRVPVIAVISAITAGLAIIITLAQNL